MITITSRINEKIEAYINHCLMGVYFLANNHFEEAANKFRMSGEAFMKMIIYHQLGDIDGHEVIMGRVNVDGTPKSLPHSQLNCWDLQQVTYHDNSWIAYDVNKLINTLRTIGNENSHDRNYSMSTIILKEDVEKCFNASKQLTCKMFTLLGQLVPDHLSHAYDDGVVDEEVIDVIRLRDMDSFMDDVNRFEKTDRYILISPFKMKGVSERQMHSLLAVNWSIIVDFDAKTKEVGGLYHSMLPDIGSCSVPITIESKDDPTIISKGISGNVNWIFANGLNTLPGTVTADVTSWYGRRYPQFLKTMLREFCKLNLSKVHVVCLLDEIDYVEELVHIFSDIEFAERDLVSFSFISENEAFRTRVKAFNKFGFDINCYSFSLNNFLTLMDDLGTVDAPKSILIPARDGNNDNTLVDFSDIYGKLASNGILLVHRSIGEENKEAIASIPKFYLGETITWKELESGIDVQRAKYDELRTKISHLLQSRQSQKFNLFHYAGAGGTTLSRRLAYDMRNVIPTILVSSYKRTQTFSNIDLVYLRVQRPVLAIVEASMVGSIDDLISECNAKKRIVIFVYVERTLKRPRINRQEYAEVLSDKMRDADEKTLFLYKVQLYHPSSQNYHTLEKTPFSQSEVIDYALSIAEQDYKKENLRNYVYHYTAKVSEPVAEFLTYVSMIYYYAQKPVSDVIFRKVFVTKKGKIGMDEYFRSYPEEKEFMMKLLTIETNETTQERLWRPRFSIFANVILEILLGGKFPEKWKNALPEWSRKLIRTIKENNEYLVDEVHDILKAVFLERDKEDMLGYEEQWEARGASEKFSQLLEDLLTPEEQKLVLIKLVEAYNSDSHFWGHLARFCYENANTPSEFEEAAGYIEKAFRVSNIGNDYTLLHIAGMCQRRRIEYYNRNGIKLDYLELKSIVTTSKSYFAQSRSIYPKNIHAYMSEIQLLVILIEYGKSLSHYDKYSQFLTAPENSWFFEQYQEMSNLMDELHTLVDQTQTLGITRKISRTSEMLVNSESRVNEYFGNYREALSIIREHIKTSDRLSLPRLRMMYVRMLLLSKVDGDWNRLLSAWELLSDVELAEVKSFLNKNVEQDSSDVYSMRLWLQAVRYGGVESSLGEIKSRLKAMYGNAQNYPMARLEAAYYMFVFKTFELLKEKEPASEQELKEVNEWLVHCINLSPNDKHVFEWLKHLDGIDGIINYLFKPDFESLVRLSGTISTIKSNMQGEIRLACGLNAFFTPSIGNFIRGKDETTPVTMNIGFRHDGLVAFRVVRLNEKPTDRNLEMELAESSAQIIEDVEDASTVKPENVIDKKTEIYRIETAKKQEFKILGKIDLDKLK